VLFSSRDENAFLLASLVTALATWLHWQRFRVPVTIAAGTASVIGFFVALLLSFFPAVVQWLSPLIFLCGVVAFSLAMYWDTSDIQRVTHRTDAAFWLHLLAAPLLVHPIFSNLGIFEGNEGLGNMVAIVLLYLSMTLVSIIIDRRAFMVSSLAYVLYALSSLFNEYGFVGYSFAVTGIVLGSALLLLSAFWHKARAVIVSGLPASIRSKVP
jgi:hypothetical protein